MNYPAPTPPHPGEEQFPRPDPDSTPNREMTCVIDRIQDLEDQYRASIQARTAKLQEQQDRYSDLQSAVDERNRKYKSEIKQLKSALRKSEQKQAAMARRLAQALQEKNEDEASHLQQLIRMHDEQIATMQEGMRELLHTLGVEESVIGNLENLCGVTSKSPYGGLGGNSSGNGNTNSNSVVVVDENGQLIAVEQKSMQQQQQQQHLLRNAGRPTEDIVYDIRRQNCELAIALRKAISIVREKLDVEEQARVSAQQKATDAMDAATVVEQALQKAGAILLKEEASMLKHNGGKVEAISVPSGGIASLQMSNTSSLQQQSHHLNHSFQAGMPFSQHSFHNNNSNQQMQQQQQQPHVNDSQSPPQHPGRSVPGRRLYPPTMEDIFRNNNTRSVSGDRGGGGGGGIGGSDSSPAPRNNSGGAGGGGTTAAAVSALAVKGGTINVSSRIASSIAVLKDIVFGSLDVVRDIEKIVDGDKHAGDNSTSSAATLVAETQVAVDRARAAERAIAGQALLELRREVEAHQHTRLVLQRKIAFLSSQYDKVLQAAAVGGWAAPNNRGSGECDFDEDQTTYATATSASNSQAGGLSRGDSMSAALAATLNNMPHQNQQHAFSSPAPHGKMHSSASAAGAVNSPTSRPTTEAPAAVAPPAAESRVPVAATRDGGGGGVEPREGTNSPSPNPDGPVDGN